MVRIITDSAAEFEPAELIEKEITCIHLKVAFGDAVYQDNVNLSKSEFYELLASSDEFPKTSQPSPFEFESVLEGFKDNGDECVIITISSELSGTFQNVTLTKNMLEYDNCYIVDSLNATGGQRILIETALKLRDEGKSAEEIAEYLTELRHRVVLVACVDTLEYLCKGGRLSKAAYTIGTMVNIKPIICISDEGKAELTGKTLSIKKGLRTICDNLTKQEPDPAFPIYVLYAHNRQNADLLVKNLRESGVCVSDENIFDIGATIGSHVGPNACGYVYISK